MSKKIKVATGLQAEKHLQEMKDGTFDWLNGPEYLILHKPTQHVKDHYKSQAGKHQ